MDHPHPEKRNSPKIFYSSWECGPHPMHQCLGPLRSPLQTAARSLHALSHFNYATNSPSVTLRRLYPPPPPPQKNEPSRGTIANPNCLPHSEPSRSTIQNGTQIQSAVFPQSTSQAHRQTDRQTDRQIVQATRLVSTPAYALLIVQQRGS